MQFHFLNKQNNQKLIIFFAGWSFDYKPFEFLDCGDFDVIMVSDYNDFTSWCARLSENNCRLGIPAQHETTLSTSQPFNYSTDKLNRHSEGNINFVPEESIHNYPNPSLTAQDDAIFPETNLAASKEYYLIAWSMGVYTAYLLKDKLPEFQKKVAINGTPYPVDDEFGIPQKPFLLTLRHAKTGLEGKFYQNIFEKPEEYDRYIQTPVERPIENRVTELNALYEKMKNTNFIYEPYYDKALVSSHDKIFSQKNQINFWKEKAEIIESGHFPFYNFKSWNEILCR